MKIINTAREITFFAGSKPPDFRVLTVIFQVGRKNGTRIGEYDRISSRSARG